MQRKFSEELAEDREFEIGGELFECGQIGHGERAQYRMRGSKNT